MRLQVNSDGRFKNLEKYLRHATQGLNSKLRVSMERIGQAGVAALAATTPKRSGATAAAWRYQLEITETETRLSFHNDNIVAYRAGAGGGGHPLAILIQYGHGTGTGGYVEGIDFINPALKPIFDEFKNEALKAVKELAHY